MDAHFRESVHLRFDLPFPVFFRAMLLEERRRVGVSLGVRADGVPRIRDLAQRGQRGRVELSIREEGCVGAVLGKDIRS